MILSNGAIVSKIFRYFSLDTIPIAYNYVNVGYFMSC